MKRLVYVDNFSVKNFQEIFNASSLKMMSDVFEEITYYTSKSNKIETYSLIDEIPKNIKYKFIPIFGSNNFLGNIVRHFIPIFTSSYVIIISKKTDIIFFNFNVLWAMPIINFLSKFLEKKVILMCHGEMEFLTKNINIILFLISCLRRFLSKSFEPSRLLYFCVLGDHIKENLKSILPETIFNKFIYFNHSHVFNSNSINNNNNLNTINLGIIVGTMRENKWISSIIELGKKIKYYPNINLKAIGRVYYDVNKLNDSCIKLLMIPILGFYPVMKWTTKSQN